MKVGDYRPHFQTDAPFDPNRCSKAVWGSRGRCHQCLRKVYRDGVCRQHHPDSAFSDLIAALKTIAKNSGERSIRELASVAIAKAEERTDDE